MILNFEEKHIQNIEFFPYLFHSRQESKLRYNYAAGKKIQEKNNNFNIKFLFTPFLRTAFSLNFPRFSAFQLKRNQEIFIHSGEIN
jgi:hypothetical protein